MILVVHDTTRTMERNDTYGSDKNKAIISEIEEKIGEKILPVFFYIGAIKDEVCYNYETKK
jgi:hypothetical protein